MREDSMTPQEREQRKSKRDAQDRALWDIAAKVTDTSPIDNKQQSKKDELVTEKCFETLWLHPNIEAFMINNSGHYFYSEKDLKTILKLFKDKIL